MKTKNAKPVISNYEASYLHSLHDFNNSEIDKQRAPSRYKIYSYSKDAKFPILYRHYNHLHDDVRGFNGYKAKSLSYCKFYVFIEAKLGVLVGDNLYATGFGKVIVMRTLEEATVFYYALQNLEYYEFDFPNEFFEVMPKNSPFHKLFYDKDFLKNIIIDLNTDDIETMFHLFEKIDEQIEENTDDTDYLIYSRLIQLVSLLCKGRSSNRAKMTNHKLPLTLKKALEYISDNYFSIHDTKQIAEHCHISVSYLCRLFKNSLGTSPIEYMNSQKISRAKQLLKRGHNVTETCYSSGFNSYNYFISTFKKTVGQTPTQYQKNELSKED